MSNYHSLYRKFPTYSFCLSYSHPTDNPRIGARKAIKLSMRMTKGDKWDIFVMGLSFIGWSLVCILTLYIGFLWLAPYMQVTYTNMYYKLKELSIESGACLVK